MNISKALFQKSSLLPFKAILYALINEFKRVNISSLANTLGLDYEKLQYFLSGSKWNHDSLNTKRINVLKNQRATGFAKDGLLIIDDTGILKPYAEHTKGVSYQHCPVLGTEALCNAAVASCYSVNDRYIPMDVKFYRTESEFLMGKNDPDFKSKLELAKGLIDDAQEKQVPFRYVVFDSWYSASDVLNSVQEKGLHFITEVKSDRKAFFVNPQTKKGYFAKQDKLVMLIKTHLWHRVRVIKDNGRNLAVYSFASRLKSTDFPVKVFVVFGNLNAEDNRDIRIIVTNDLNLGHKEVVLTYLERWAIERLFREIKDSFYFDHYQVRHKLKIMRYWMMVILAWTLIYWIRQNDYLYRAIATGQKAVVWLPIAKATGQKAVVWLPIAKATSLKGKSMNECKQALLKLILFSSYQALRKNNVNITSPPY